MGRFAHRKRRSRWWRKGISSNDLLREVRYSDHTSEKYWYNGLGEVVWKQDRNTVVHDYVFDELGRMTSDRAGNLSKAGVDRTIERLNTEYDALGKATLLTSWAREGGVFNQVKREYNGFGQLIAEYQDALNIVSEDSAVVRYDYAFSQSGNYSRLDHVRYPDNTQVSYGYGVGGVDDAISRIKSVSSGGNALESYKYLGLAMVVMRERPGTVADLVVGVDSLGRLGSCNWGTVDEYQYSYTGGGQIRSVTGEWSGGGSVTTEYEYDGLKHRTSDSRGWLTVTRTEGTDTLTVSEQQWLVDSSGSRYSKEGYAQKYPQAAGAGGKPADGS